MNIISRFYSGPHTENDDPIRTTSTTTSTTTTTTPDPSGIINSILSNSL